MQLFFNAASSDPASALARSLSNNQPGPRPTFTLGDNPEIELHISDGAGGYSVLSGDPAITPWLGIGTPGGAPSGGVGAFGVSSATSGLLTNAKRYQVQTYVAGDDFTNLGATENASGVIFTATGTTPTDWTNGSTVLEITAEVSYAATAATLEAALEATQAVTAVSVSKSGTSPVFIVEWDSVGARDLIIGIPAGLTPASSIVTSRLQTGSASAVEKQIVRLTRQPYALQTVWADSGSYWTARLDCNTRGLLDLLDGAASIGSTLELQLIDGDGNIRTIGQTACLIRNEAIDEESTIPAPFPAYPTTAAMLLACIQNRYAVTGLTGGGAALDGIVTGTTANPTVQTASMVCIEIATLLSFYELVTGTDATSSPSVIRPADYSASNERVWKLRGVAPSLHASTHASGGSDPVTLAESQVTGLVADLAAKLALAGGTMTGQLNFSGTTHAGIKLLSLTTTQRNALTAANGMLIYNTTTATFQKYEAGAWADIASGGTPAAHATSHQNGGSDEISVAGLSGLLADSQTPLAHSTSHKHGGSDEVATATPTANAIPKAGAGGTIAAGWIPAGAGLELYSENPVAETTPVASGDNAVALGSGAVASALSAIALGLSVTSSGIYSFASGAGAIAANFGQWARANGFLTSPGDSQASLHVQRMLTADATPKGMASNGVTETQYASLPNYTTWAFKIMVVARRTDASENDAWEFAGLIHREANAASTTLDAVQVNQIGATAWTCVVTDSTGGYPLITVTGEAAKTIQWVARIESTETTG